MSPAALVLQHGDWGPPGLLGDWAGERGIDLEVHRVDLDDRLPDPAGRPFVVSLGSKYSPLDRDVPEVAAELDLLGRALGDDVAVLGLCYGGQMLATALGGKVERAPEPELGWHELTSAAPEFLDDGPWLQWHYDRFTLPPQAEELARSERALQAFAAGPHIGVQFHPESTIEIVCEWARLDADRLREHGIADGEALVESGRGHAEAARHAAFRLFDAFRERASSHRERGAT